MKKKKPIIVILILAILFFSVSLTAIDPISVGLELLKGSVPKPVYSIWDGLEKVKMANEVDQLSITNDTLAETEKQSQLQIDTAKLIAILSGNVDMIGAIENKISRLENMTLEDWLEVSNTDIIDEMEDILGMIAIDVVTAEPDPEEKKIIKTTIDGISGLNVDNDVLIASTDRAKMKKKLEDTFLEKVGAEISIGGVNKNGEIVQQNIRNSTPSFIGEKQSQLNVIEEALNTAESTNKTSIIQQLKYNNQLQVLNAQINLKMLNSLNLLNEANYVEMLNSREKRLKEDMVGE